MPKKERTYYFIMNIYSRSFADSQLEKQTREHYLSMFSRFTIDIETFPTIT